MWPLCTTDILHTHAYVHTCTRDVFKYTLHIHAYVRTCTHRDVLKYTLHIHAYVQMYAHTHNSHKNLHLVQIVIFFRSLNDTDGSEEHLKEIREKMGKLTFSQKEVSGLLPQS